MFEPLVALEAAWAAEFPDAILSDDERGWVVVIVGGAAGASGDAVPA